MNGDGPQNNWAHGIGSFYKENVVQAIEDNRFRGPEYRACETDYIEAITSCAVDVVPTSELLPKHKNLLLVIDVQGYEKFVLDGIDWSFPPRHLIVENWEVGNTDLQDEMAARGYDFIGGKHDLVFSRA